MGFSWNSVRTSLVVSVIISAATIFPCGCTKKEPEKAVIARGGIITVLPLVAQERGHFAREGISVQQITFGDGKKTLEALVSRQADFATIGEPPLVERSFRANDFRILGSLAVSDNATRILARRDRGITSPADLAGKRIGVRKATISHSFLYFFLKKNGIPLSKVDIRFMDLKEMPDALARGEIDAYSSSDLFLVKGQQLLGDKAIVLQEKGLCYTTASLVIRPETLRDRPALARKVIRGLLRAQDDLSQHPGQIRELLRVKYQLPGPEIDALLDNQRNVLVLEKGYLLALEEMARWMQAEGYAPKDSPAPDFLKLIDPALLREERPSAVAMVVHGASP